MDDIKILKLKSQGYCCSQIMVLMVLEILERENDDLVNFSRGLCIGGGVERGPCGILTAGISILAMYAKKGDERFALMQDSYITFFQTHARSFACKDISGSFYPAPNPDTCAPLLSACHSHIITTLVENGFDPADSADG